MSTGLQRVKTRHDKLYENDGNARRGRAGTKGLRLIRVKMRCGKLYANDGNVKKQDALWQNVGD